MFDHRDKDGGLWQFEVGPSIWEGLDRPTGNPLRMVFDALGEEMPVETYDGISMWTEEGHWRFQVGDDEAPGVSATCCARRAPTRSSRSRSGKR